MQTLEAADRLNTSAPFRFTKIAGLGDFSRIGDTDLNNLGAIAFSAGKSSDSSLSGVYTSSGRKLNTIADTNSLKSLFSDVVDPTSATATPVYGFGSDVEINNRGTVLFEGKVQFQATGSQTQQAVERLFLKQGSQFTKIAEVAAGTLPLGVSSNIDFAKYSLNDRDQVVYATSQSTQTSVSNTVTTSILFEGKTIASALTSFGRFPSIDSVYDPVITKNGTIFYVRTSGSVFGSSSDILRFDLGATQPVTVSLGGLSSVLSLAVNDEGTIVFSGRSQTQGLGLFQLNAQGLTKLSDIQVANEALNNRGTIAYQPGSSTNLGGISVLRDGTTTPVIAPGDVLFKLTVNQVNLGNLNNRNQISFAAAFADGTVGVFRANLRRPLKAGMASDEVTPDGIDTAIEQIGTMS